MGIIQTINEALSVKQLSSMFYTGYSQVSPGNTRIEKVPFDISMATRYNAAISNNFMSSDPRTNILANMLASIYTKTYTTKRDLFELYRSVKDLDQASVIIDDFIDDAFNTPDSDYPFTIEIGDNVADKDYIEKNLVDFIKRFDIYQLDRDINEDYLVYGDYYLSTSVEPGQGITEVYDNVECENVFSIYKGNHLLQHIAFDKDSMFANSTVSGYAGQLRAIHPDLLSHFILDGRKITLDLPDGSSAFGLPENIKLGRGVLFSSLALLKKYQLLDIALTYKEVRNALMPVILGIATGAFTTPDKMIEASKTIESYLQEGTAMSFDLENTENIESLLQSASFKVAPIPGDKGTMNKIDVGQGANETDGLSTILNDTGSRIATTSGGVTSNESGKSRLEILKSNSRRSKKLVDIQRGKAIGWRGMFHKHLRYQYVNIEPESIKIQYKSIPNADIFEEANGLVTLLSVVNDLQTYSDAVNAGENGVHTNPQKIIDAFNLFIGNRYKVLKDFIELDVVKNEFPAAADAILNKDKISVPTGAGSGDKGNKDEPEGPQVQTGTQSSTALTKMNKSFDGSSGSSSAVGQ